MYFVSHYAELIPKFGPPISYWTARYESKHRIAKVISELSELYISCHLPTFQNFAESSKNVKNISWTLSERQQMRAASIFYRGMFCNDPLILPEKVTCKSEVIEDTPFHLELKQIMQEDDLLSATITFKGQKYSNGDLVVLSVEDCDRFEIGLVKTIMVKGKKAFLVCDVYDCQRTWLQYFESEEKKQGHVYVEPSKLADYKPLVKRGTSDKFIFTLHHRISFSYN